MGITALGSQFLSQLLNSVFFLGQFLAVQFYLFNFITVGQSNTAIENLVHISTGGNSNVHINGSIDQVVALGGGHIHRCGNGGNFPLSIISLTNFRGRYCFTGKISVFIPFCGTSSLGYTVKTGLIRIDCTALNNHNDTVTIRNASVAPRNCVCIIDIDDSRIIHTITKAAICIAGNLFAAGQVNGFQVGASRKRCFKRCIIANHFQIFHLRESLSFYILQVCIAHSNFFELFTRREHIFPKSFCRHICPTGFQCAKNFHVLQRCHSRVRNSSVCLTPERILIIASNFCAFFNNKGFNTTCRERNQMQCGFAVEGHSLQIPTICKRPYINTCHTLRNVNLLNSSPFEFRISNACRVASQINHTQVPAFSHNCIGKCFGPNNQCSQTRTLKCIRSPIRNLLVFS